MGQETGPAPGLGTTSYLVLGLVGHLGSATGYDLKRVLAGTIGQFWSVPHSQLYAEPARLAGLRLLLETQEQHGRRRRTYTLTPAGRRALDQWLAEPTEAGTELRDPALLRLYFGAQTRPGGVGDLARRAATVHREQLAALESLIADPPARADLHQLSTLALAARYETQAIAFWDAVAVDPDLT